MLKGSSRRDRQRAKEQSAIDRIKHLATENGELKRQLNHVQEQGSWHNEGLPDWQASGSCDHSDNKDDCTDDWYRGSQPHDVHRYDLGSQDALMRIAWLEHAMYNAPLLCEHQGEYIWINGTNFDSSSRSRACLLIMGGMLKNRMQLK